MVMASLAVDAHGSRVYYAALLAAVDGVAPDKHRRLRSGVGNEICVTVVAAFVGRGGCDFWHILCLLHRGWRPCNEYSVEQVFWLLLAPRPFLNGRHADRVVLCAQHERISVLLPAGYLPQLQVRRSCCEFPPIACVCSHFFPPHSPTFAIITGTMRRAASQVCPPLYRVTSHTVVTSCSSDVSGWRLFHRISCRLVYVAMRMSTPTKRRLTSCLQTDLPLHTC